MKYYAVADIAGEFDALMRLVDRFEPNSKIILLGDTVDRGPKSKEVVEWAMKTPNVTLIMGNHEHMMIDWVKNTGFYNDVTWTWNGGLETLYSYFGDLVEIEKVFYENSYGQLEEDIVVSNASKLRELFPKNHLEFLESCLKVYRVEVGNTLFTLSHAPLDKGKIVENIIAADSKNTLDQSRSIIWNRGRPVPIDGEGHASHCQIFGHNSHWGLKYFGNVDKPYAICLDASRDRVLTAIELDSLKILQEPYKK